MKANPQQESNIAATLGVEQGTGRKRRLKVWLILALLLIGALTTGLVLKPAKKTDGTQYRTQQVRRGDLVVSVTATGTLEPTNQVEVGSELSGIVRSVEADYNDRVKTGQVLARLDTSKLQAQNLQYKASLASAEAKVLQARATLKEARGNLDRLKRVRELSGNKVPSQYDLDAAEAALERAAAEEAASLAAVSQARAILEANETDLAKALIRSPINGIVLTRSVEPGQTVAASLQAPVLFTLAEDLARMELHVAVDEADVGQVREGQEATFTVDAYPDRSFRAQITQVRYGSKTTDGVVTYETLLKVDNSDLSLRPGMTATAEITVNRVENALLIPNAALRFTPPGPEKPSARGGLVGALLPRPPRRDTQKVKETDLKPNQQRVWTLRAGKLAPLTVATGATDGTLTEVTGGDVAPGTALVVE
ncbi:MAG: efflux RND transporter periplasmic adaptor subunit [Deltaproteobacteria bacterium]|nr:efflux RND transporter periplasmic adaptor subunit [Deltaproteobacteria bacterium]